MTTKVVFKDDSFNSALIESSWKSEKKGLSKTAECQTSSDLYEFDDSETQTTVATDAETQVYKITDKDEEVSVFNFILDVIQCNLFLKCVYEYIIYYSE
jgi:hypothetical protein